MTTAFFLFLHLKVLLGTFKYYKAALQGHEEIRDSPRTRASPTCCCASLRAELSLWNPSHHTLGQMPEGTMVCKAKR